MPPEEHLSPGKMAKLFAEQCALEDTDFTLEGTAVGTHCVLFVSHIDTRFFMQVNLSTIDLLRWAAGHHLEGMAQCAEQVRIAWKRIMNGETIGVPSR